MLKSDGASVDAPKIEYTTNGSSGSTKYIRSSIKSPCPVCGRTKDKDCSLHPDGKIAHCKTYVDGIGHDESKWHYNGVNELGFQGKFILKTESEPKFVKSLRPKNRKEYYYPDRDGRSLVKVTRIDDGKGNKSFPQSRWDGGKWINDNPDHIKQLVPIYRYVEVRAAIERNKLIFIVEGEAAADALWKLGIAATTTIGGSGGYANYGSYPDDLVGARLALSPDRDAPGLEYMSNFLRDFASQIEGWYLAGTVGLWKNPQGGMDIGDDLLDHKYTKEQILEKVLTPENYQQISIQAEASSSKRVEGADKLSALYQHLSAESIKQEVEAIFDRHLSQLNVEAELTALSSKLRLPKQSIEKIYNELELAANASADKFEIDKILSAQSHSLTPLQILPLTIANKIEQVARARGTNSEALILGLLVACSSVPHANTRLEVGNHGDILSIYSNLFGMAVGDSGTLKSPTIKTTFAKPLRSLQKSYTTEYDCALKQYERDKKAWEASDGNEDRPVEPRSTVIVAGDATIEKLEDLALYQPKVCPALYRDELIGLFQGFEKHGGKGGGDARSKLLSYYDGIAINSHRMGAGSKISQHDFHPAVFGGIQPDVLRMLAQQIGMDNDGTLCRFLYAPILRVYKAWDTEPDTPRIDVDTFDRLIDNIHRLPAMRCYLDASAQRTWAKIADRYNHECLNNPKISAWLKHSYSKAIGQLGKLSLTLHLIECASADNVSAVISSSTIEKAAVALDYFMSQAIAMIATTEGSLESHLVRVLGKAKELGSITPREVQTLFSGKKRIDAATAKNYLQQLAAEGYGLLGQKVTFTPFGLKVAPTASADNADKMLITYQQPELTVDKGYSNSADNADNIHLSKNHQSNHQSNGLDPLNSPLGVELISIISTQAESVADSVVESADKLPAPYQHLSANDRHCQKFEVGSRVTYSGQVKHDQGKQGWVTAVVGSKCYVRWDGEAKESRSIPFADLEALM